MSKTKSSPVVRSDRFAHDMGPWLAEKTDILVSELARLADHRANLASESEKTEEVLDLIWTSIHQATKVLAFSTGSDWEHEDAKTVFEQGFDGYIQVCKKWGIFGDYQGSSSEHRREQAFDRLRQGLAQLIAGPRSPNRTLIHDLLAGFEYRHGDVEKIIMLAEEVTMGRLDWEQFTQQVQRVLDEWE